MLITDEFDKRHSNKSSERSGHEPLRSIPDENALFPVPVMMPTRLRVQLGKYRIEYSVLVGHGPVSHCVYLPDNFPRHSQLRLIVEPFPHAIHLPCSIERKGVHLLLTVYRDEEDMRGREIEQNGGHWRRLCVRRIRHSCIQTVK